MFGIGYQEMFVILVLALVVFGPHRLPELAGQVGRWVRQFRTMTADLTGEFEKTIAEVEDIKQTIRGEMQGVMDEVEGVGASVKKDLSGKPRAVGAGGKTGGRKPTPAKSASGPKEGPLVRRLGHGRPPDRAGDAAAGGGQRVRQWLGQRNGQRRVGRGRRAGAGAEAAGGGGVQPVGVIPGVAEGWVTWG